MNTTKSVDTRDDVMDRARFLDLAIYVWRADGQGFTNEQQHAAERVIATSRLLDRAQVYASRPAAITTSAFALFTFLFTWRGIRSAR